MENLSFSKKHHAMKSMYDDVLTGAQKFSATSLAPRLEDYTEIFGGFHGSRGRSSSIPVLDLPPVEEFEVITVSSSDYSDVFTGFHGVEFAPSFQDLVNLANGGYDSSDEAWSPAHSGSLSDETYPSAWSERSQSITNGDIHHPVNDIKQFNLSYQKAHQRSNGDGTTGMAHITHLHAIPGYTCIVKEKVASENREDEKRPYQGTNDPNYKEDFGVRVAEDKRYTRDVSLPMNNDFQKRGSRLPRWETRSKSGPIPTEPLITVSDINLRTRPSHLPPPSRPPPVLAVGRGESEKTHPKPKSSRSTSAASLEDALCRTEGYIRNSSNSTDLQDEGLRASLNLQMEDDIECLPDHKDGRVECTATLSDVGNDTVGHHAVQWSQAEEVTSSITPEERLRRMNMRDGIYGEIEINLNRKSVKGKLRKSHTSSLGSSKSEEIVMWREAAGYFEVETDFCSKDYKERKEDTIGNTDIESFENQWQSKTDTKQKESCDKAKLAKIAPERGEKQVNLNKGEVSVKYVPVEGRSRETSTSIFQMEDQKSVQGIGGIVAPETNKEEQRVMQEEIKKVLYTAKSIERNEDDSQHENVTDTDLDMKGASERTEKTVSKANSEKRSEMVSEEVFEIDHLMNRNNENDQTDIENKGKERRDEEEKEKQQNELLGRPKKIQKETHLRIGPKSSELVQQKDEDSSIDRTCKQVDVHHAHEQYKKDSELSLAREEENMVKDCHKLEENEMDLQRSVHHDNFGTEQKEAHQRENGEKLGAHPGIKVYEMRSKEALDQERCRTRSSRNLYEEGAQKNSTEASGVIIKENKGEDTSLDETSTQKAKTDELKKNVTNKGFDRSTTFPLEINGKLAHEVPSIKEVSRPVKGRQNMPDKNLGFSRQVNNSHIAVNTAEQGHPVCPTASINDSEKPFNNVAKILPHMVASDLEVKVTIPKAHRAECIAGMQVTVDDKVQMKKLRKPELASEWVDTAKNISDALQTVLADVGDIRDDHESEASQGMETKMNNVRVKTSRNDGELKNENFMTTKDEKKGQMEREKYPMAKTQKVGGPKGRELHDEHLKRIEEEREREREREKDKTAVENTIREARGRAYVDARERAALERATSEARQRAMAEARERLEKASAEAREARLKAERAAVERATTEARQRAFEKTMAARCNPETNDRVDRTTDKFPSKEMKQSGPACDSYNIQMQNGSRYTNSSAQVGIEGESPQRCKARLERHQRTAERAAKALAEKNMRDLVAQREQEERNRLAEILDADVKRWSSGKEGNLRALLSTLQYILGSDSGWQPIPLTEVITSAAVKRVYRKATLCVHPDKLQQRGANTQQKYICEKVFDLLKEAWNKFNSEER